MGMPSASALGFPWGAAVLASPAWAGSDPRAAAWLLAPFTPPRVPATVGVLVSGLARVLRFAHELVWPGMFGLIKGIILPASVLQGAGVSGLPQP